MSLPKYVLMCVMMVPLHSSAQGKWGYGVSSLRVIAEGGKSFEILFVSPVKRLDDLDCKLQDAADATGIKYAHCICDWFYGRLGETNPALVGLIDRESIYGDVELYADPPARIKEKLPKESADMPTVFLHKKEAEKRRSAWIALARTNKNFVVEID